MMPYTVSHARLAVDPNQEGLVCGLNMRQEISGTVFDVSGNGNDFDVIDSVSTGQHLLGDFLNFSDGGYLSSTNFDGVGNTHLVSMWCNSNAVLTGLDQYLLHAIGSGGSTAYAWSRSTNQLSVYDGSWTSFGIAPPNDGLWHHLVFFSDATDSRLYIDGDLKATVVKSASVIGTTVTINRLSFGFNGKLIDCCIKDASSMSVADVTKWVATEYNKGRRALWKTNPVNNVAGVTSGFLGETPFVVDSGSFDIVDSVVDNKNAKVVERMSPGFFYLPLSLMQQSPSECVRGYYEWWQRKSDAGYVRIGLGSEIDPSAVGNYRFDSETDETLKIVESGVIVVATSSTAITPNVWEKVGVAISSGGTFELFLNGVSVGTGTNAAITEAIVMGVHLGADCAIALGSQNGDIAITKRLLP